MINIITQLVQERLDLFNRVGLGVAWGGTIGFSMAEANVYLAGMSFIAAIFASMAVVYANLKKKK